MHTFSGSSISTAWNFDSPSSRTLSPAIPHSLPLSPPLSLPLSLSYAKPLLTSGVTKYTVLKRSLKRATDKRPSRLTSLSFLKYTIIQNNDKCDNRCPDIRVYPCNIALQCLAPCLYKEAGGYHVTGVGLLCLKPRQRTRYVRGLI